VSEDVLQKVRDGLNSNAADDADILEEARSSISSNGWSPEFNKSLVGLIGLSAKQKTYSGGDGGHIDPHTTNSLCIHGVFSQQR